jgi:hypothetical protein
MNRPLVFGLRVSTVEIKRLLRAVNIVTNSQYRNAVASGCRINTQYRLNADDPTLPRFGTDCLSLRRVAAKDLRPKVS